MGGRLSFMRVVAASLALSLLCSFVLSAAPVKKITVNIEGKPLKEALETIKIASGYSFFYSDALDDSQTVSLVCKEEPVDKAVSRLLKPLGISWQLQGSVFVLSKDKEAKTLSRQERGENQASEPVVRHLRGSVTDPSGKPVIGATVMVKGKPALGGTITDANGNFSFSMPEGESILVTCVGYTDYEQKITGPASLIVVLEEDALMLEDAVVVGYGVQQKESVVGAIAQVGTEKLVNSGTTNLTNAIAGKLTGVQTYQTSGQPGNNDATIYIRGLSSWNGSSPLVMVDGVERQFSDLDPNEVKSISVLKAASATAVFGARGANGVILVTTRQGTEGRPKMNFSVESGVAIPTDIPDHVSSYTTAYLANIAKKNVRSFDTQMSDAILAEYKNPSSLVNQVRYPDNDYFDMMVRTFAPSTTANFNITGGTKSVKYFVSVGYTHEGSAIKQFHEWNNNSFTYDRVNYRLNLDMNLTPTTTVSLKAGGNTGVEQHPSSVTVSKLFTEMYDASPLMWPAYFPEYMLELFPDPSDPGASGKRLAAFTSGEFPAAGTSDNPMRYIMQGEFTQTTTSRLFTDLILNQKLDFITKGLSLSGKASLSTSFYRYSLKAETSYPIYRFDWAAYDNGDYANVWDSNQSTAYIYEPTPYKVYEDNAARSQVFNVYLEASLNYARKFGKHSVTGLLLGNRREANSGTSFPHRSQGLVSRFTYDYNKQYLLEVNMGYTGSEQFAPEYRYGFFPSVAVGYVLSKHKFWRKAMPWWSKMKFRYSDGLVGSDQSSSSWLYYASFTKSGGKIYEDKAANTEARWETARKQDLGIEMGWLKDRITFNVDLFNEIRTDMLIAPIVTPMVGLSSKEVNRGSMKKHGIEFELGYKNTTATGLFYELGAMLGLNENRIVNYEDPAYAPEYQKYANTPYKSTHEGMNKVGNGYFNDIDEIHMYPSYTTNWNSIFPGSLMMLDYTADGKISSSDLHVIRGSQYPSTVYSFNFGIGYKGFELSCLFYGNHGKYVAFDKNFATEFGKGRYLVHKSQMDYWRPDHHDATHPALTFDDETMYNWAGGNISNGFTMRLEGETWRKSDYLTLKEIYMGYSFNKKKIKRLLGVEGLSLNLTGNNLYSFTNLIEGNPQVTSFSSNFYPIMATVKFGARVTF